MLEISHGLASDSNFHGEEAMTGYEKKITCRNFHAAC
jgi:hypothetical protein